MEERNQEQPAVLFKREYEKEYIEELTGWFSERMGRLPKELRLDKATMSHDLPKTVGALVRTILNNKDNLNVTYSGYVSHLALIRRHLKEQGIE